MRASAVTVVAGAVVSLVLGLPTSPVWAEGPAPATTAGSAAAASVGRSSSAAAFRRDGQAVIKVTLRGRGSYSVIGRKFKKSATSSRRFTVPVGRSGVSWYRIKAKGASAVYPRSRLGVNAGGMEEAAVAFGPVKKGPFEFVAGTEIATAEAELTACVRWSPDGKYLSFLGPRRPTSSPSSYPSIYVKSLATGQVRRVTPPKGYTSVSGCDDPGWSPDGSGIGFLAVTKQDTSDGVRAGGIYLADAASGTSRKITDALPGGDVSWSPDGRIIYGDHDHYLVAQDISTGEAQRLPGLPPIGGLEVSWSPDGTRIAFSINGLTPELYYNTERVYAVTVATGQLALVSTPNTVENALEYDSYSPQWSPDGRSISFSSADGGEYDRLYVKNLDSGSLITVPGAVGLRDGAGGSWAPDSSSILFAAYSTSGGAFVSDLSTGKVRAIAAPIHNGDEMLDDPVWSPAGDRVAFLVSPGIRGMGFLPGIYVRTL